MHTWNETRRPSTSPTLPMLARRWMLALIAAVAVVAMPSAQATTYQSLGGFTAFGDGAGGPDNQFGAQVAVDGDLAVVATAMTEYERGKVHTFERVNSVWTRRPDQLITLLADYNVAALSLQDGFLIVGVNTASAGNVRVYRRSETGWQQELSSSLAVPVTSVAIDGYIGVYGRATGGGVVTALRRNNATETWSSTNLNPSVSQMGAEFGASVSIVAGLIAVGAPKEDVTSTTGTLRVDAGAAYVFELTQDTWSQEVRLVEPDADLVANNQFGAAVATSGSDPSTPDRLLVSSIRRSAGSGLSGRVRSYTRANGNWTPRTVILSSEPAGSQDGFGCALRLDGDWAVVGACESSVVGNARGAVSVLRFNSAFTSVLSNTQRVDSLADDAFSVGRSLAIDRDGPTLMIGNPRAEVYGNQEEGVVLVGRGIVGGTINLPVRTLDLGQGYDGARAGIVSYDGSVIAMSAFGEAIGNQFSRGAVYLHRPNAEGFYPLEARVVAPDGAAGDSFGRALDVVGDSLLVGAPERAQQGLNAVGAVYAFRRVGTVWSLEAQITPPTPIAQKQFGRGLVFDGSTAVICDLGSSSFVYTRAGNGTWSLSQTIAHGCETPQINGDRLILNNPFADVGNAQNIGEVATYQRIGGSWQLQSVLAGNQANQQFGYQIATDNDVLVVTSTGPTGAQAPAQVYRTNGGNWIPEATLQPNDGGVFCHSAEAVLGRVFLGCPSAGKGRQAVYVFDRSSGVWAQVQKLADVSRPNSAFGGTIEAHADGRLFIAALAADVDFEGQGIAHMYMERPLLRDGFE